MSNSLHSINCSTPGFLILHCLLQFVQTHAHWVGDVIQPYHPLSPSSPLAFNLSQQQGLFQWVDFWHQVAKVLELQFQHQSFHWIFEDWFPLGLTGLISLQSKGLLTVFSSTTVKKHQFFGAQPSLWSSRFVLTHGRTLTFIHDCWKNYSCDYTDLCQQSDVSAF